MTAEENTEADPIVLLHSLSPVSEGTEVKGWTSRVRFLHPAGEPQDHTALLWSREGLACWSPAFADAEPVREG